MVQSYAHILRQLAKERPDAPALTFAGETWTFAQLNARSSQTACALKAAGVEAGDRVALLTKNCAECFELMFACNKIGAILTGLNWRLAPAEIQSIVADAMPTVIITSTEEAHLLTPTAQEQEGVRHLITLGEHYQQWRVSAGDTDPGHEGAPDEVALLLYTSGTTGLPKGVMLTNQGMSYTPRLGTLWGMSPDCVNLVAMPMFHIGGCGYGTSAMTVGGHTVLMREVNTAHIIHLIEQYV